MEHAGKPGARTLGHGRHLCYDAGALVQIAKETGELVLFALEPGGLRALASGNDAELNEFVRHADSMDAPLLGINPALIDRDAWGIANKGGSADARGRLH